MCVLLGHLLLFWGALGVHLASILLPWDPSVELFFEPGITVGPPRVSRTVLGSILDSLWGALASILAPFWYPLGLLGMYFGSLGNHFWGLQWLE